VGHADAREEETHVVVDLRDGPHGRPRVAGRPLLIDGDGRRKTLDEVDVRLLHLTKKLARIGRERLDVAALSLRVDRVEGEG